VETSPEAILGASVWSKLFGFWATKLYVRKPHEEPTSQMRKLRLHLPALMEGQMGALWRQNVSYTSGFTICLAEELVLLTTAQ
jgi:hypothetical protein